MPLDEDVILALIDEQIRERDIEPWAIRKWSEKNLIAYIPSISLHHTGNKEKDREVGQYLIRCAIRWALALDKQFDIKKWYAIAATPEGEKLLNHLGFKKIPGKREGYILTDFKAATRELKALIAKVEKEDGPLIPTPKKK